MAQSFQDRIITETSETAAEDRVRKTAVVVMVATLGLACVMSTYV